jgi:hypothetical protein
MTLTGALVDRSSRFLEAHMSRRNFINRSAFVGSAVAVGSGVDLALKPGTAYGAICACGDDSCGCGTTCCSGFTDFCCAVNGGYNYCPSGTVMGGWWQADNSTYCGGPRYYMDCNATCQCTTGCDDGYTFCEPGCDGVTCGCGPDGCNSFLTGCLQFRYGQCNQDVACVGRIVCRVVACIPPWEIDPSCTTAVAVDDGTAEQNVSCWTTAPPAPPPLPYVAMAAQPSGGGYAVLSSMGKLYPYGNFTSKGDESAIRLEQPMVGLAVMPTGAGYWLVAADGGIFTFGDAQFFGSTGDLVLNKPIVGMAATPTGAGYWLVAADGGIFSFGDAPFDGSTGSIVLNRPVVGMAVVPGGAGYWLVAADGGIFAFDAAFYGSPA